MPQFSRISLHREATCHRTIRLVTSRVIKEVDCKVLYGHRSVEEQYKLFLKKCTKLDGRNKKSYHNFYPSLAIDIVPYPVQWPDAKGLSDKEIAARLERFYAFGGFVLGVARTLGIDNLYWGNDWNGDWNFMDQSFNDLPHFELRLE